MKHDSATCYKSIYINIESNAGLALGVIILFAWFTSRVWEKVAHAILSRDVRWIAVFALAANLPSWYYSCKVSFVYVNEYLHLMQRSQLFFALTEMAMTAIVAAHVRGTDPLREPALAAGLATSLFHLVEILLDEQRNLGGGSGALARVVLGRNLLLLAGDAAVLAGLAALSAGLPPRARARAWRAALALLAAELLLFQLCVADEASWRAFS